MSVPIRVLFCGGRKYANKRNVYAAVMRLHIYPGISELIHGAAKGADTLAGECAAELGIKVTAVPAEWDQHGNAAGPRRNQKMLAMQPDLVVAFTGGGGTANMVEIARLAGVRVVCLP